MGVFGNVEITGVCDTFSPRAELAAEVSVTSHRAGGAASQERPKIYPTYREMIVDGNIDAILIQTPDHLHAKMTTDAARAGIHVYLEKPMCQTDEEAKDLKAGRGRDRDHSAGGTSEQATGQLYQGKGGDR